MTVEKKKNERSESKLTPEWRSAYPYVHVRRTKRADGAPIKNPTFDMVLLAPKLHPDPAQCPNYRILLDHCYEAGRKMWPASVDASGQWVWPNGAKWPIMDGDVPYKPKAAAPGQPAKPVDPNAHAWRKGSWQVEVSHFLDPGPRVAVLQNGQTVEIPAQVVAGHSMYKSGDYCHVSLHAWAYERETFGVNFGFEGVCFTRPGEAIGSSGPKSAAVMFGGIAPMAPPTSHPAPTGAAPRPPGPPTGYAAPAAPAAPAPQPQYAAPAPALAAAPAYAPSPGYAPPPGVPGLPPLPAPPPAAPALPGGLPPFPGPR